MESLVKHRERAKQIIDFTGLQWDTITPTDIDGLIEYKNKAMVFIEFKYNDAQMPKGQELALQWLADDSQKVGKEATVLECIHFVGDCNDDVIAADAIVRRIYYKGKWYDDGKSTVKDKINSFISYVSNRRFV